VTHAARILIRGTDALNQAFQESTTTVSVNCYGCQYQSKQYVQKNSVVTIEIPHSDSRLPRRIVRGHVVWVQRPRTYRHLFMVGIEFDIAGNVWGIQPAPKDWFPHPEDEDLVIPVYLETAEIEDPARSPSIALAEKPKTTAELKGSSQQAVERAVQAAVANEMERVRTQIDAHIHQAVEGAVIGLIERVTNAAVGNVIQQAHGRPVMAGEAQTTAAETRPGVSLPSKRRRKLLRQKT
jgi:hypothetical protein